jgi:hypothetical protein
MAIACSWLMYSVRHPEDDTGAELRFQELSAMQVFRGRQLNGFWRRGVFVFAVVAALAFLAAVPMTADHLEGKQQALGKPEHMLSGIDVYKTTIAEVIKMYGEPTSKRDIPAEGVKDGVGGTRDYIWERKGLRLLAGTGYHNEHESEVYNVDVWGSAPEGELGKSGRGLTLGSTLQHQKAVYGDRFFNSSGDTKYVSSVLIEWHDGTQMVIDYDVKGRIFHMQLSADTE